MKPSFGKTTPRGHRKFNIPSHLKQKGSRKTRELERRLAELEKAMGKAADKEESPVEIVKARGQMSKRGRFVGLCFHPYCKTHILISSGFRVRKSHR